MKRWEPYFWPIAGGSLSAQRMAAYCRCGPTLIFFLLRSMCMSAIGELVQKGLLLEICGDSLFRVGSGYLMA